MNKEYTVQTPAGARVLTEIKPGSGFAHLRFGFAPDDPNKASERLEISSAYKQVHVSADGTFISYQHLWAILIGLIRPGNSRLLTDIRDGLFYMKPDLNPGLMRLFESYDPANPSTYWREMIRHGYYAPQTGLIHRYAVAAPRVAKQGR